MVSEQGNGGPHCKNALGPLRLPWNRNGSLLGGGLSAGEAIGVAVVPACLRESWWAKETREHGLNVSPLHICQTPRRGRCRPAPVVDQQHRAGLAGRQGAGVP